MRKSSGRARGWRMYLLMLIAVVVPLAGVPAQADDPLDLVLGNPGETYPDLVPETGELYGYRPVLGFDPETGFTYGPPTLAFDTWSQNLGTVALELTADDPSDVEGLAPVSQCVSWRAPLVCRERRTVGDLAWHDEHSHFHYQGFALYELRRLTSGGAVDYSASGLVSTSDKVSFCMIDSTPVRDDAAPIGTYLLCTHARQGISPGYADIYTSDLDGQQLSMAGLSDGRYALVITQDHVGALFESDDTNNRLEVILDVTEMATSPQVAIVERRWPTLGDGGEEPCPGKGGKSDRPSNGRGKGKKKC